MPVVGQWRLLVICVHAMHGAAGRVSLRAGSLAAVLAMLVAGCSGGDGQSSSTTAWLPVAGYVGNAQRGQDLFRANCAACHGRDAGGTERGPPLVNPIYRPGHHADLAFYFAVHNGVQPHHWHFGPMPPVKGVSPKEVADIIAWVRQRQRRAGIR
ncbi:MAG: cytochrome c [Gammaproteobacteria bacterium]